MGKFMAGAGIGMDLIGMGMEMFGGGNQDANRIDPNAALGLKLGVEGAGDALAAQDIVGTDEFLQGYRDSAARLMDLEAPDNNMNPEQMIQRMVDATAKFVAPQTARALESTAEAAGAFGPQTAINQSKDNIINQNAAHMQNVINQNLPELYDRDFNQDMSRFQAAMGLERERQNAVKDPFQIANAIRQGYTGQLMNAGRHAASVPQQYGVPAGAAALRGAGDTLTQGVGTFAMLDALKK